MAKKYMVSVAVNVPFNWEVQIEADNEKEASEKALNTFHNDMEEGMLRDTECEVTLDVSYDGLKDSDIPKGVYVEAVTE